MSEKTVEQKLAKCQIEIRALKKALGTLIAWLPQSAGSPLRVDEAQALLSILDGNDWP